MTAMKALGLVLLTAALSSCITSRSSAPINLEHAAPRHSRPTAAWALATETVRAIEAGAAQPASRPLGYLVRFESVNDPDVFFFSVRNGWHQELGLIDHTGRAYRFQPHGEEAEWLSSGTVEDGMRAILQAPPAALLREIDLQDLR